MANIDPQVLVAIIGLIGIIGTAVVTPIVVPAIRDRRGTDRSRTGDEAYIIYTVERGDTVGKIARRYNTTVEVVMLINDLPDPDLLVPGDELLIPRGSPRDT